MIELIEAVRLNYKFLHPMDLNDNDISNFCTIESEKQILQSIVSELPQCANGRLTRGQRSASQHQVQQTNIEDNSSYLEHDISLNLYSQLEKMFIHPILEVSSFI
jgi:hypothetical protein